MTMQKVDDRHHLSLPLFYPDYKPGCLKSRSSKDVQFIEGSPRSSRSQSTQISNHKSTRQHWESNPSRPKNETSLKSCLRKSSEKRANDKENFKDSDNDIRSSHFKENENDRKVGGFKETDNDLTFTATEKRSKSPKRKWRATKVEHKDSVENSKENSENVKMKGFSYPRFRYPLRFHYGSAAQSKSGIISAVPAGFRTVSFYSSLPRRQRQVTPGNLPNEKNRKGKDDNRKHETKSSTEEKTEVEDDKNSRASSPEMELNGVYHIVHETKTPQVHDNEAEQKRESKTTHEDNHTWTTQNQPDDDDDEALEVKDNDADDSNRRSSRSSHSNRSEESIKEAGSSSDEKRSKNESGSSDDVDRRRSRKKEKKKNKRKKKNGKMETKYAADFDDDNIEVLSVD